MRQGFCCSLQTGNGLISVRVTLERPQHIQQRYARAPRECPEVCRGACPGGSVCDSCHSDMKDCVCVRPVFQRILSCFLTRWSVFLTWNTVYGASVAVYKPALGPSKVKFIDHGMIAKLLAHYINLSGLHRGQSCSLYVWILNCMFEFWTNPAPNAESNQHECWTRMSKFIP